MSNLSALKNTIQTTTKQPIPSPDPPKERITADEQKIKDVLFNEIGLLHNSPTYKDLEQKLIKAMNEIKENATSNGFDEGYENARENYDPDY